MKAKSYRDLEIYQLSFEHAMKIHKISLKLPKYELYEEGSQSRKSSKGVTSCIVEGYGRRRYKNDFIRFLTYAQAPCDETEVHLCLGSAGNGVTPFFLSEYDDHLNRPGVIHRGLRELQDFALRAADTFGRVG